MFKLLRKHKKVVFGLLGVVILAMLFFGIGGNSLQSSPQDVVMKVNGVKITQGQFDRMYNQMAKQQADKTREQQNNVKKQALDELVRLAVFDLEAQRYGLHVSDIELQRQLANTAAFQKNGQFDYPTYVQTVYQVIGMSPKDFEKLRKKDIAAFKLTQLITSSVDVPDSVVQDALPRLLALETDEKKKKELRSNPDAVREELKNREANLVFSDWLNYMNSTLKVELVKKDLIEQPTGS